MATTLLVEAGTLALIFALTRRSPLAAVGAALLVNLVVHTLFWRLQPEILRGGMAGLMAAEAVVVGVEALAYRSLLQLTLGHALGISLGLNLLSYHAGILVWMWYFG